MKIEPLSPKELEPEIDNFEISKIIQKIPEMPIFIGRKRAEDALNFGLDIKNGGYHIFVLGPPGIGKNSTIAHLLEERSQKEPAPSDWCYVFNFKEEERPIALELPFGCGRQFKESMDSFIDDLKSLVSRVFDSEEYIKRLDDITKYEEVQKKEEFKSLSLMADKLNYQIGQTPFGIMLSPAINGHPLSEAQIEELDKRKKEEYEKNKERLLDEVKSINRLTRKIERDASEKREKLNKDILAMAIDPFIEELKDKFSKFSPVLIFLDNVKNDIVEKANQIKSTIEEKSTENILEQTLLGRHSTETTFNRYSVNLFISHQEKTAPIIKEPLPTVPHLAGRFEFRSQLGGVTTDFKMLRPGALQLANGGYLVLDAIELLTQPFSWSVLKTAIQSGQIRLEEIGERLPFSIPTPTLRPEPIPLKAKIILIGPPIIYYLLAIYDKDFLELFRIKADFDTEVELSENNMEKFIAFIYHFSEKEIETKIDEGAIRQLIKESHRLREHQKRASLNYRQLTDILKEASFWANKRDGVINQEDIKKAVSEKILRSNLIEEKVFQMIEEGTLFIDVSDKKIGTVNGLSVLQLGDYEFGKPTRITARTFAGKEGVVNIERVSQLSGPIHGKAVMILANYIGGKYAQDVPLFLNATLTFEQEYGFIEGDSATVAEIVALISSLADLPVRQDLAITGSANQYGDVQPIGGVNQKIEGFYSICRMLGSTGTQGVIIPKSNQKHLVLKDEVIDAVKRGEFQIYAIENINDALEILLQTDIKTIEKKVKSRLIHYAETWRRYAKPIE
ncbi:MAG: ATP-dependent protease [Parcubacteria group bacterium GW2011_GWF2_38_76]|nr:MAG: ATP-dependent protease [Parcubacteria group bacterium GW2011_GWF2_38_76]